jgi:hypothetical protein
MTKIIGIDPGNKKSALVVLKKGKILNKKLENNKEIRTFLKRSLNNSSPQYNIIFIETIKSYGNVQGDSIIQTAIAIGRFVEISESMNIKTFLIPRKTYVSALCKFSQANDKDIRAKMIEIYGRPGTKTSPGVTYGFKDDLWQALGLATYGLNLFDKIRDCPPNI